MKVGLGLPLCAAAGELNRALSYVFQSLHRIFLAASLKRRCLDAPFSSLSLKDRSFAMRSVVIVSERTSSCGIKRRLDEKQKVCLLTTFRTESAFLLHVRGYVITT